VTSKTIAGERIQRAPPRRWCATDGIGRLSSADFRRSQIELAVGAGVVLALAIGFLLINRASPDARPT
jgi:hypothetical protein